MIERIVSKTFGKTSFFLFGPRQTGKSFLIQSLYQDRIFKVNLLLAEPFKKYSEQPGQFRRDVEYQIQRHGIQQVFVDEVQKIPLLLDEVHHLIETYKLQFILTGSSARKLKRKGTNLLAGRAVQKYLFPYCYSEIKDDFHLEHILRFGSLAPIYGNRNVPEQKDILRTYVNTYLKEEIQAEGLVRNLGDFSKFLDLAASQSGELINFSGMGRDCQLSTDVVQGYYQILEDTLIGFRLQPWRSNPRKRMVAHPKFYFFDVGVVNAINQNLDSDLNPRIRGHLFEQLLVLETHRLKTYRYYESNLYFWRTSNHAEVDLLIERQHRPAVAVEFKSTRTIVRKDITGLLSLAESHPHVKLLCVADVDQAFELHGVEVLPWQTYLEQLDTYLAG